MQKYLPLGLAVFLTSICISIVHSIFNSRPVGETSWMSYGLEGFVFLLFALGMFVVGGMQQDFCENGEPDVRTREIMSTTHHIDFST